MTNSRDAERFTRTLQVAAFALACATDVPAADFFVNSYFEDSHDLVIDGTCDATAGGQFCTLRAAIEEAEASGTSDTIFLGTGTTTLTLGALPDLEFQDGSLLLVGDGHGSSSIVGAPLSGDWMIASNGSLGFVGLRIAGFSSDFASAVTVEDGGTLIVENTLFEQNQSAFHAASIQVVQDSVLVVRDTAFANGVGGLLGGEIDVIGSAFDCDGCTFEGGKGTFGGAVFMEDETGTLDVRIENSLFAGNRAPDGGGAIYAFITSGASSVLILNTTISGNSTEGYGGGVWAIGTNVRIQSSTIVGNVANSELSGGEKGGGIALGESGASVALANSIVSGNLRCSAGSREGGCTAYAADDCVGSIVSNGFNLVRTVLADQCSVSGGHSTANPLLLSLDYNGGSTRTIGLAPGSPAKDAGNPAGCQDGLAVLLRDQRGAPRPAPGAGVCDLGALESGALIFDDDFELWEWKWSEVAP